MTDATDNDDQAACSPGPGSLPRNSLRLSSGIEGLDVLLLGGFVRHGLYIIQGAPGAGKTILGNQICYAHAATGGRSLFVTLLSEQHERLFANLGQMSFFDQSRITREISYVSAFQLLERDGLTGLLALLRREIVTHAAGVLVLDGMVAAEAYASTELQLKKFVHELQMLAAAAECTMFLLTTTGHGDASADQRPEHTMVDGMITLRDLPYGWRVERDIQVRKFRGSDHLRGHHAMRITADGIMVWPRTESLPLSCAPSAQPTTGRVSTGVPGLDAMMHGGLPAASSSLVLGPTGTGKTALGLQFLSASTREAPGMLLSFYETPAQLVARAGGMAPKLPALVEHGVVTLLWQGPTEDLIDRAAFDLLRQVRARGIRRVVLDGMLGFQDMTVQPERIPQFYRALTSQLRELGVTTLCTAEVPELAGPVLRAPLTRLAPLAENLIMLRHVEVDGRLERVMSVMKVRDSAFDTRFRRFEIGSEGITLVDRAAGEATGPGNAAGHAHGTSPEADGKANPGI